jgi:hypothetical protein
MIAVILGLMPALNRRLSIALKSGMGAKVVSNPAKMPKTWGKERTAAVFSEANNCEDP